MCELYVMVYVNIYFPAFVNSVKCLELGCTFCELYDLSIYFVNSNVYLLWFELKYVPIYL